MNILRVLKLVDDAQIPKYATDGAACFDLVATEDAIIIPGTQRPVKTGLAFEVPMGKVLLVYSRSGHGFKNGVRLVNAVGVIDSDYRGELMVGLRNDGNFDFVIKAGDRIAQALVADAPKMEIVEVTQLTDTARGTGGMGSTGK